VEQPIDAHWPKADRADLYLEGSDQHRGWFQSSLLESVGTRGHAPYRGVLTHGFVLDEQGRKMSKSLGNTLAPQVIAEKNGAEILRLWAASSDFTEDLRIGQDIIKANVEAYRRLRNTVRFMLANLDGFDESERIIPDKMQELELYMLARLAELNEIVRKAYEEFDFGLVHSTLFNFCTNDLSAFYFDIRKDSLYCDRRDEPRRSGARTVMDYIFKCIVTWYAPILCFTMEEAWTTRFGADQSVHLNDFFVVPASWKSPALIEKWKRIRAFRRVVTGAVEIERAAKRVGSSLEACPVAYFDPNEWQVLDRFPARDIAITSGFELRPIAEAPENAFRLPEVPNVAVVVERAEGEKCARCWMVLKEVATHPDTHLCNRCTDAVALLPKGPA
jgi:isoleucyl-tRNA synthetase